jgi:hypothetical protein
MLPWCRGAMASGMHGVKGTRQGWVLELRVSGWVGSEEWAPYAMSFIAQHWAVPVPVSSFGRCGSQPSSSALAEI